MRRAIALSKRGFPAPNPRVGCVIVKNDTVAGEGHHEAAGLEHAEVAALQEAGSDARGADVYVTLEPCDHFGRTGPCSQALIDAGVRSVTYACTDPNPKAAGGTARLRSAGVLVAQGLLESEASGANQVFLESFRLGRPFVVAKAALTLDGFMAREDGSSKWITGEDARREGHRLRAELGAVLVGVGTVLADDPQLTARIPGVKNQPLRAVLDPHARLTGSEAVFGEPGEVLWLVAQGKQVSDRQAPVPYEHQFDLKEVLNELLAKGIRGLLVEGGPRTLQSFFREKLVDRLELFVSPKQFGSGLALFGPETADLDLVLTSSAKLGDDIHASFEPRSPQTLIE